MTKKPPQEDVFYPQEVLEDGSAVGVRKKTTEEGTTVTPFRAVKDDSQVPAGVEAEFVDMKARTDGGFDIRPSRGRVGYTKRYGDNYDKIFGELGPPPEGNA